ncbi:MAG TPA: nucleotidyltransferase family protein [Gemmatimonadaceae bacterium]|nr:nucleotidyltransferase family protein [Gemmatimonadaceae bacterium]
MILPSPDQRRIFRADDTLSGTDKAVILARGLGTRMRQDAGSASLDAHQARIAETGMKAMIPTRGRPFLDYILASLADAGFARVCLVIGPEHTQVRDYYRHEAALSRLTVEFAEQERPLGTADAVLATESFANGDTFAVLNSDNYYGPAVLSELQLLRQPALIGFARSGLIELGNFAADRVNRFGALDIGADGFLRRILAVPNDAMLRSGEEIYGSMNCWLFDRAIFRACREVTPSPRGELELPRAVQLAIDTHGLRMKVVKVRAPVLDLSSRTDIASVEERLKDVTVSL